MKMLEDIGYFCVDNLPVLLIPKLTKIVLEESASIDRAAIGIDIRNLQGLSEFEGILEETRRNHPLALQGRVDKAIEAERQELSFIKKRADYILDTSHMLIRDLKKEVDKIFLDNEEYENFFITILSFGFKYGIPADSDLVFDVRFLPNPFYIPELKTLTGNDREVYDYVMDFENARIFEKKLYEMLRFLVPNYITEGKNQLVVSIGCTGGRHRSVTIANALSKDMKKLPYGVKVEHRDAGRM